jgi:large repetitive protein
VVNVRPRFLSCREFIRLLVGSATLSLAGLTAHGAEIALAWDPTTVYADGTPATNIVGYKVYAGPASRNYNSCIDVGNATTSRIAGLPDATTYYLAVTTYNVASNESAFSGEVVWSNAPPAGDTTPPAVAGVIGQTNPGVVRVSFSEPLASASAQDPACYLLDNGIVVLSANLDTNGTGVTLLVSPGLTDGTTYVLTVNGVSDLAGNPIATNSTVAFKFAGALSAGLVAHWHFDEGSGAVTADSASNHDGTVKGAAWTNGWSAGGLKFDGTNDYVDAGTFDPAASNLTISVWIKWSGLNRKSQTIVAKRDTYTARGMRWQFRLNSSGLLTFDRYGSSAYFKIKPPTNTWVHLAVVRSGKQTLLYVNGALARSSSMTLGTGFGSRLTIGGLNLSAANDSFNGIIDELRLYSRPLSVSELQTIYRSAVLSSIRTSPASAAAVTSASSSSGTSQDADGDGLPDAWEVAQFGSISASQAGVSDDYDGDGVANLQEYVAGTDPKSATSVPSVDIGLGGDGEVQVSFTAVEASGTAYAGKQRCYALDQCRLVASAPWATVAGFERILATNQVVRTVAQTGCVYRTRTWLEDLPK